MGSTHHVKSRQVSTHKNKNDIKGEEPAHQNVYNSGQDPRRVIAI